MSTDQYLEHVRTAFRELEEAKRINAEGGLLNPMTSYSCLAVAREEIDKAMSLFVACDLATPEDEREPIPGRSRPVR